MNLIQKVKSTINNYNASRELQRHAPLLNLEANDLNGNQLVALLFEERWERFFWIKQLKQEITQLVNLIEQKRPKMIVEIGTNMGGTLFLFSKIADPEALIISIDLPDGPGGGGYPKHRKKFYQSFAKDNQNIHLLSADSHDGKTLLYLKEILNGQQIDFLFLDGDHTYEGIKNDFEMYSPLVKKDGLIAFHDIKHVHPDFWVKVEYFWNEIKNKYEYDEFLSNEQPWGGIGVLHKK